MNFFKGKGNFNVVQYQVSDGPTHEVGLSGAREQLRPDALLPPPLTRMRDSGIGTRVYYMRSPLP